MLRIPSIHLTKKQGKQTKYNQQICFNIMLPQITVHLLSDDCMRKGREEYRNLRAGVGQFPFKFPGVDHPRTLLVVGEAGFTGDLGNSGNYTQIGFKLATDYKKKTKDISINLQIANIQSMTTPSQIKILSRFVSQVLQFKKILDSVLLQLKQQFNESINMSQVRNSVRDDSMGRSSNDLFSSIMISFSQDMGIGEGPVGRMGGKSGVKGARDSGDIFKSMIREDQGIRESFREFSREFGDQIKKMQGTETMEVELQVIEFKQSMKFHVQVKSIMAYILKYSPTQQFLRIWHSQMPTSTLINPHIGCDYFLLQLKKIDIILKQTQKISSINLKSVNLYNIKLHQKKQPSFQSFYDIGDSFDFQNQQSQAKDTDGDRVGVMIQKFYIGGKESHFCVEEIFSVLHSESQFKKEEPGLKKYSFLPQLKRQEDQYVLYKPGIGIHMDNKQQYLKINIQVVTISTNLQLLLDCLNIAYPLMAYKRLADIINFKRNDPIQPPQQISPISPQPHPHPQPQKQRNIFESRYQHQEQLCSVEELKSQNKNTMVLEIAEVKLGFRKAEVSWKNQKGQVCTNFAELVQREKEKIYQEEAFNKVCFCNVAQTGIYLQLRNLKFQKKFSTLKLSCKIVDIGIMEISQSKIQSLSSILQIKALRPDDAIRILKQTTYCDTLLVYIPQLNARFSEDDIVNLAGLAVDTISIGGSLMKFKEFLEREIMFLEKRVLSTGKKSKKNQGDSEKQIRVYVQNISLELDYCNFVVEQLYVTMNSQMQETLCCKISTIKGGIKRQHPIKLKICEFKNNTMQANIYTQHANNSKNQLISESEIFLSMGQKQKQIMFKVQDRTNFLQKLQKQHFTFTFKLTKQQLSQLRSQEPPRRCQPQPPSKHHQSPSPSSPSTSPCPSLSQRFQFKQAAHNLSQTIQEEGQKKILTIQVNKQVTINLCNFLELRQYVSKLEKFVGYVGNKMKEAEDKIKAGAFFRERRESVEIQNQVLEVGVRVAVPILVDIWPDFICNQQQKIFTNTRSIITITLHNQLSFIQNKDKNQKQLTSQISLNYNFLLTTDRQPNLNPLQTPTPQDLSDLGYKQILSLNKLSTKVTITNDSKTLLSVNVQSLFSQCSIATLNWLALHFQHFFKHHVQRNIGMSLIQIYDADDFCNLQYDPSLDPDLDDVEIIGAKIDPIEEDDEFQIENISGALQIYRQKIQYKNQQQQRIRSRTYTFESLKNPQISIQQATIQKICIRISQINDFDFIKFQGVSHSAVSKRTRMKENQEIEYYVLKLKNFCLRGDLAGREGGREADREGKDAKDAKEGKQAKKELDVISSLVKLDKIQVYRGSQKNYGHCSLKSLADVTYKTRFVILQNESQIITVFEKNPQRILLKFYNLKLSIGGTTLLISSLKKSKQISQQIQRSGWQKVYQPQPQSENLPKSNITSTKLKKSDPEIYHKRLIVFLPESTLKVTFQYANIVKIIDEQTVSLKELLINQEVKDQFQIKRVIKKWGKSVAKNNIAGFLSGTALNLIVKLFSKLVSLNVWWIGKIIGPFFGANADDGI